MIAILQEKKNLQYLKYYGNNDYLGRFFVKGILDNLDWIEQNLSSLNNEIADVETLYLYLWRNAFVSVSNDIDSYNIDSSYKNRIKNISKSFIIENGSFIRYINENYTFVFDKKNHESDIWHCFFDETCKLCFDKFKKTISENVIRYIESNFTLNILSNFKNFEKYYINNNNRLYALFDNLKNTKLFDDNVYLKFLENYKSHSDPFFCEQAKFICERTIDYFESLNLNSDSEIIFEYQSQVQEYSRLACIYKLTCYNRYNELKTKISHLLDEFIIKHGQHHQSGPYDLTPAIKILKENESPYKFLQITHNKVNNVINNSLDYIFTIDNKNNPLSENFNDISRYRSDKYPFYKQDSIKMNFWLKERMVNLIISDENLVCEFANYIYNISIILQEKYFNSIINIEKETSGIVDALVNLIELSKNDSFDSSYATCLMVGTGHIICSVVEKILRNVAYKECRDESYFDDEITLHNILKNYTLKDISKGLKYHLEFYLIKQIDFDGIWTERPGLNIRNNLMHGNDETYGNFHYGTLLDLFYLMISLLDDLFVSIMGD